MERRRPWTVEFTQGTKNQIRREQKGRCYLCGAETTLEFHHCIPVFMGGTRERVNGIGVCHDDHTLLDNLAQRYGIAFDMAEGVEYHVSPNLAFSGIV